MANTTIPFKIAKSNNSRNQSPVVRAVTSRETSLLSQIGELKEKLLLAEIAMDEKDVRIAKELKRNKRQKAYIRQFDEKIDQLKLQNLDATDKFYQLKTVANRASDIAKEKHEKLKQIETELDKQQQALVVSQRIQVQLMDLIVKQSVETSPANREPQENITKNNGFFLQLKMIPQTLSQFLKKGQAQKDKSMSKTKSLPESVMASLTPIIPERIIKKLVKGSTTKGINEKVTHQPKSASQLPQIKWRATAKQLPPRSGLYYVSDGKNVEIALFNAESQRFNRTDSYMPIDYWCVKPKK